jgi:ankyrin repeat protein
MVSFGFTSRPKVVTDFQLDTRGVASICFAFDGRQAADGPREGSYPPAAFPLTFSLLSEPEIADAGRETEGRCLVSEALPARPHLDWYRKAAKKKLASLREHDPNVQLADAQLALARELGFGSWRQLKARIDELRRDLPAMFDAIRQGNLVEAKGLLSACPELARIADESGQTALHIAAERNDPAAIDLLLSHGADPEAFFGRSAHTALSWALTTRAFAAADALVKRGAKPDFFCAAGMGDLERLRSFFDESGHLRPGASHTGSSRYRADGSPLPRPPTDQRDLVSDALYFASRNGHASVVRELLQHDPDLSFRAYLGGTPLHWAYWSGEREVVDLLLSAGADPTLRDVMVRCTPRAFGICVAANWGFPHLIEKQLENDPALINILDGRGTPLHEAARGGSTQVVQFLLDRGADPTLRDGEGKTPADLALDEKVRELLRSHLRTSQGSTP